MTDSVSDRIERWAKGGRRIGGERQGSITVSQDTYDQLLAWLDEPPEVIPELAALFARERSRTMARHPVYLIKSYYNDVAEGKYSALRDQIEDEALAAEPEHNARRVAHLTASRARIIDKVNLIRDIVASGLGADKGETLSDDDFLMVIAGWAAEMRNRYKS